MSKLFLLFSHTLTSTQSDEAIHRLKVTEIRNLPESFASIWGGIPPEGDFPYETLEPIVRWLAGESDQGDYVLIQGEFGAVFLLVEWAFRNGRIPIYATTERVHQERKLPGGQIEVKKIFHHKQFRRYPEISHFNH